MNGILLYYQEDALRNASYIRRYQEEGTAFGMEIRLLLVEDIHREKGLEEDAFETYFSMNPPPDFVINRTRKYRFGEILETKGIPVFNSSLVSWVGNDKWYAYTFFKEHLPDLPVAETNRITSDEELSRILFSESFREYRETFPVFKSRHGHGGQEVFLLSEKTGCDAHAVYEALSGKSCICQRRILTELPTDIRVYILGGRIYAAMMRTGQPGSFLANYSKGGHALPMTLNPPQTKMVEDILNILPMDYAGMDFIQDMDGNWYLGEIEDMVGARMLWETQGISPVGDYLRHIRQNIL